MSDLDETPEETAEPVKVKQVAIAAGIVTAALTAAVAFTVAGPLGVGIAAAGVAGTGYAAHRVRNPGKGTWLHSWLTRTRRHEDDYDERVAHVAVDRQSEPPRTLAQWRQFEAWCRYLGDERWLPGDSIRIDWPEGERIEVGPGWIPVAEDHPFKGCHFCWRCLAEAQEFPTGNAPHKRDAICWEASGDPDAEDGQPDACETLPIWGRYGQPPEHPGAAEAVRRIAETLDLPEDVICPGVADPSRPALAGEEEFRVWWQAGASIVAKGNERPTDFADTGTFFYDGPGAR